MPSSGRATHRRRAARRVQIGRWLAVLALGLRLIAPSVTAPALPPPADAAELIRLFGAHALCLSQETGEPGQAPTDRPGSDGVDHRFGTCCFWHCNAGSGTPPPLALAPVAFPSSGASFPATTQVAAASRRSGIARARAPPRDA